MELEERDLAKEGYPEMSKQEFVDRFFDGDDQQKVWVLEFEFFPLK